MDNEFPELDLTETPGTTEIEEPLDIEESILEEKEEEDNNEEVNQGDNTDSEEEPEETPKPKAEELTEKYRREAQSMKDKYISMQKKLEELEAKLSQPAPQQAPQEVPGPTADPLANLVIKDLEPFASKLQKMVDEGEITEADAQLRYEDRFRSSYEKNQLQTKLQQFENTTIQQTGKNNILNIRRELRTQGVAANSEVEKEVFRYLKSMAGLDYGKPETFAAIKPEALDAFVETSLAVAERRVSKKGKPTNNTQKPVVKSNTDNTPKIKKGYSSFSELTNDLKRGIE